VTGMGDLTISAVTSLLVGIYAKANEIYICGIDLQKRPKMSNFRSVEGSATFELILMKWT